MTRKSLGNKAATDGANKKHWRELAAQAANEKDSERRMGLIKEIQEILQARKQRLKDRGQPPIPH
jgi:uncharacterized protein YgfB (UPF0149 family)